MKSNNVTCGLAAAAVIGVLAGAPAAAADIPNLVGTWKAVDGESVVVRFGAASEHTPEASTPTIVAPGGQAWTMVVEKQDGRAFHGHAMSPKGEKETFVGVVHRDGEHLVIAGDDGELEGEYDDGKLDLCWTDDRPGRAVVACSLFAKE
jgi:hypothetical protein